MPVHVSVRAGYSGLVRTAHRRSPAKRCGDRAPGVYGSGARVLQRTQAAFSGLFPLILALREFGVISQVLLLHLLQWSTCFEAFDFTYAADQTS